VFPLTTVTPRGTNALNVAPAATVGSRSIGADQGPWAATVDAVAAQTAHRMCDQLSDEPTLFALRGGMNAGAPSGR
jgi:hypothetical protein